MAKTIARALIYAVLFVAAMELVVDFARYGQSVTPLWVASAILAWALITAPMRDWGVIVGFAAAGHILRSIFAHDTPAMEAIYLAANVGAPLACAALIVRYADSLTFDDRHAAVRFMLSAGIAAPAVSVAVVFIGSFIEPSRFKTTDLPFWFLADALSFLVFLPIFKSLASGGWRALLAPRLIGRTTVLLPLLIGVQALGFFLPADLYSFFTIFLPALLIYIAFELGVPGARLAIALSAIAVIAHALIGPVSAVGLAGFELILAAQLYVAALVICVLPLAEALAEKQRLYEDASSALADALAAWGELIAAEAHYRLIADNTESMVMRIGLDGDIVFASPACSTLSANVHDLEGRKLWDLASEADAPHVRADLELFVGAAVVDRPHTLRARLRDARGGWGLFELRVTLIASHGDDPAELIAVLREASA